jgi:hypothetical protein
LENMSTGRPTTARLFARLPVLDFLKASCAGAESRALGSCALVAVQHLLDTTGSLFESLTSIGLLPQNIFVLGKLYSANKTVEDKLRRMGINVFQGGLPKKFGSFCDQFRTDVKQLWAAVKTSGVLNRVTRLVVLDDGGYAISEMPGCFADKLPVRAVEQTMSGIELTTSNGSPMPIVDVASSAAKTLLEPKLIREAVLKRIRPSINSAASFGVIGLGNIGVAIASSLVQSALPVFVFDKDPQKAIQCAESGLIRCNDAYEVFTNAGVIFGCAGSDLLEGRPWWRDLSGEKTLISCSSLDQEFRTVLGHLSPAEVPNLDALLSTVKVETRMGVISILRGGFPINFDGSEESVPASDIQLTRGLLMAGIIQASMSTGNDVPGRYSLSASAQKKVVRVWLNTNRERARSYTRETLRIFDDDQSILAHSCLRRTERNDHRQLDLSCSSF